MTDLEQSKVRRAGSDAAHLAAIGSYLAAGLSADPDMGTAGEAVEALVTLAEELSARLLALSDPNEA